MVERAAAASSRDRASRPADLRDLARRREPVDVLVSNATLQWVPGHLDLLPALVGHVAPGGWFAFQVPGNFDEPSHALLHELAAEPRVRRAHRGRRACPHAHDPAVYADALRDLGLRGRRLGDDVPARARPARTRSSPGSAAPAPGPTLQALPDDLRRGVRGRSTRRCCARPTRPARTARRCRSAGSSWSPRCRA